MLVCDRRTGEIVRVQPSEEVSMPELRRKADQLGYSELTPIKDLTKEEYESIRIVTISI